MRTTHAENPFHRIQQWVGQYYRHAHLWETGAYLLLPHIKGPTFCDTLQQQQDILETYQSQVDAQEQIELGQIFPLSNSEQRQNFAVPFNDIPNQMDTLGDEGNDNADEARADAEFDRYLEQLRADPEAEAVEPNDDTEEVDYVEEADPVTPYLPSPNVASAMNDTLNPNAPRRDVLNNTYVRIVHSNGIHHLALVSCQCHGSEQLVLDLFGARLLPASFHKIQTLFSAQLLDLFRLCNLELHQEKRFCL